MRRTVIFLPLAILLIVVVAFSFYLVRTHNAAEAAKLEAQSRHNRLASIYKQTSEAVQNFNGSLGNYAATENQAVSDSQERRKLYQQSPNDIADELTSVRSEEQNVIRLQSLTEDEANSARGVAYAMQGYFSDEKINLLLNDISSASDAQSKYLADWRRAATAVDDLYTNAINGRGWDYSSQSDVESLYRATDEDRAVSASRWSGVSSEFANLQSALRYNVAGNQNPESTALAVTTAIASPTPLQASSLPQTSQTTPVPTEEPNLLVKSPARQQVAGPIAASNVLSLLRATSALTVSTNPDGHTAYITVPDTPASGTADAIE
jgi:hypothetical protein